jgi:hypothetical protein
MVALELMHIIQTPEEDRSRDVDMLDFRVLDRQTTLFVNRSPVLEQELKANVRWDTSERLNK